MILQSRDDSRVVPARNAAIYVGVAPRTVLVCGADVNEISLDQNNSIHDVLVGSKNCEKRAVWRANVNLAIQRIRRGYHGARMPCNLQSLLYGVAQQVDNRHRTVETSISLVGRVRTSSVR